MRLIFISLIFFLLTSNYGFGQTDLCQNIYIWDFKTKKNERNSISNTLSNEVEDALSQINDCKVLQRRKYANIQQQVDNEIQISKIEDLSDDLRKKLKTIQAERVLFGEIEQDFSFNLNLRLSLENLYTKQIKTSSIMIKGEEMINPSLRVKIIQDGIIKLLNLSGSIKLFSNNEVIDEATSIVKNNEFQNVNTIDNFKFEIKEIKRAGEIVDIHFLITNLSDEDRHLKFIPFTNMYYDDDGNTISSRSSACISTNCNSSGYKRDVSSWRNTRNPAINLMPSGIPIKGKISIAGVSKKATKFIRSDINVWINDIQHELQLWNLEFPN